MNNGLIGLHAELTQPNLALIRNGKRCPCGEGIITITEDCSICSAVGDESHVSQTEEEFSSEQEAMCFIAGVEFVNDSYVTVYGPIQESPDQRSDSWWVLTQTIHL